MVQITGEGSDPETLSTSRLVARVKDEEPDSLQLLSSKNVISHKCCSPLSYLFCHYSALMVTKYPMDRC
jgi:hypothetical protein